MTGAVDMAVAVAVIQPPANAGQAGTPLQVDLWPRFHLSLRSRLRRV